MVDIDKSKDQKIEDMIAPSMKTIQATCDALECLSGEISEKREPILETLQIIRSTFTAFTDASSLKGSWIELGAVAMPITLAMKGATIGINRYVEQKTGTSLYDWSDFVNEAYVQLEEYSTQLEKVVELSHLSEAIDSKIDHEQLKNNKKLFQDTRMKSNLLKPVMGRVTELSRVIDSMLEASEKEGKEVVEPVEGEQKWTGDIKSSLQKAGETVKGVKNHITGEQGSLLNQMFSPISDLKERTALLSSQIAQLSHSIFRIEDLIDLQILQIETLLGKKPQQEVGTLSSRIGAAIIVPRLRDQLTATQQVVATNQAFLKRLNTARKEAKISDTVYQTLAAEYQTNLDEAASQLDALEAEAETWELGGNSVLKIGMSWLEEELKVVEARELVGQLVGRKARKKIARFKREIKRFQTARETLETFGYSKNTSSQKQSNS